MAMQIPTNDASLAEAAKRRWQQIVQDLQKQTGSVAKGQQAGNMSLRRNPGKRMDRDIIKRMGLP